ncbi:MAG: hypothetical protein JWN30_1762 [Bacilli bacterium]|nr:hypothetical protein [Bacilli bacterium]
MNPSSIVDLIVVIFIAGLAFGGLSRGLVRGITNWAVYGAALIVALHFSAPLGVWLEHRIGADAVIRQYVATKLPPGMDQIKISNPVAHTVIDQSPLPSFVKNKIAASDPNQTIAGAFTATLSNLFARLIGFLVVLYGVQIIATLLLTPILVPLLRALVPMPLDALGGFLLGIGTAVLELAGIMVALPLIEDLHVISPVWQKALQDSVVLQTVHNLGQPLVDYITRFLF